MSGYEFTSLVMWLAVVALTLAAWVLFGWCVWRWADQ